MFFYNFLFNSKNRKIKIFFVLFNFKLQKKIITILQIKKKKKIKI